MKKDKKRHETDFTSAICLNSSFKINERMGSNWYIAV